MNLVDLAGSENVSKAKCEGMRIKEGGNINKSLLALSNVINKLSQNNKNFVNYRDSKLTRLLQSALGGNSKTTIICTMIDDNNHYSETLNTLHFGIKAKNIKTIVKENDINKINKKKKSIDNNKIKIEKLKLKNIYTLLEKQKESLYHKDNIKKENDEIEKMTHKIKQIKEKTKKINKEAYKLNDELIDNKNEYIEIKENIENIINDKKKVNTMIILLHKRIIDIKKRIKKKDEENYYLDKSFYELKLKYQNEINTLEK